MVKVLWKVYCADNRPNIEKYEMNESRLIVSTKNKILPSTVFHPLTCIALVDDLLVVQRCQNTENVRVFVDNAWQTIPTDSANILTTGSVFYISCPSAPNCVRNGIAQTSQDQGPDIEIFFYLEDTEQDIEPETRQTNTCVLQGLIKCAHALVSVPNSIFLKNNSLQQKNKAIQSISHALALFKTIIQESPIRHEHKRHFVVLHRFFWAQTIHSFYPFQVDDLNFSQKMDDIVVGHGFFKSLDQFVRTNNCLPPDAYPDNVFFP